MYTSATGESLIRFQCLITREQHAYIKRLAQNKGIPGSYAIRKGLDLFAKNRGDKIVSK